MTVIVWDDVGERTFQAGVDRAVLYLPDDAGVPWNGFTGVEDATPTEITSYYMDGFKILDSVKPGDYAGVLKAFTYPDELDSVTGIVDDLRGLLFHDQPFKPFNLTYRTLIGNDLDDIDYGYKIHLLYNVTARPSISSFSTLKATTDPLEFTWDLSAVPVVVDGRRPTAHLSIDTTKVDSSLVENLEAILYGTSDTIPRFPSLAELRSIFGYTDALIIVDNGDGTWTATDRSDSYITMIDSTTFKITDALASYLDLVTYEVSDTYAPFTTKALFGTIQLESSDDDIWNLKMVTVSGDTYLDMSSAILGARSPIHQFTMMASDGSGWKFIPTDDGTLDVSSTLPDGAVREKIRLTAPDSSVWVLTVGTDGVPDLAPE